jgi:hypothetical protein
MSSPAATAARARFPPASAPTEPLTNSATSRSSLRAKPAFRSTLRASASKPANLLKVSRPGPNEHRPRIHLLDDGFQHRQLHRDANILLLDRRDWHDRLLPAGNLREPLSSIRRATILAIPADDPALAVAVKSWGWQGPVWRLRRTMEVPEVDGPDRCLLRNRPSRANSSPVSKTAGLQLAAHFAFPDHHRYTSADLKRLGASAHQAGAAGIVTTEKDLVRLGQLPSALPAWLPLQTARLPSMIEDETKRRRACSPNFRVVPAPTPVRKSEFAHAVQVPSAGGPSRGHGRYSPRPPGRHSTSPGPPNLDD